MHNHTVSAGVGNQLYFADLYMKLAFCFVQSIYLLVAGLLHPFSCPPLHSYRKVVALRDDITRTVHADIITEVVVVLTSPALY